MATRLGLGLSLEYGGRIKLSGAQTLLGTLGDAYGLAIDFATDQSMVIADAGTPANNFSGSPFTKLTYTAPSDKWVLNTSGVLAKVTAGAALPYEYNTSAVCQGVLIEEQRTNLLLQSNAFGTTWTANSLTNLTVTTTGPDGVAASATKLNEDATTSFHRIYQTITKAASALPYVLTVYAKAGVGRTRVQLESSDGLNGAYCVYDLAGGQIGVAASGYGTPFTSLSGTITSVGNGWYRCTLGYTSNTATTLYSIVHNDSGTGTGAASYSSYAGTVGNGVYIYQAQLEQASYVSSPLGGSPIFTTTGTVTRAADNLSLATSTFPYPAATGPYSFYASVLSTTAAVVTAQRIISFSGSPKTPLFINTSNTVVGYYDGVAGVATANAGSGGFTTGGKAASAHDNTSSAVCMNNGTVVTGASAFNMASPMTLGSDNGSGNCINAYLKQIAYWPRKVSNAELQTVTT